VALISADRVRDTSTTTGTSAFVVTGTAPTGGYRTFSAVCTTNDTFYYCIQGQTTSEWEVGLGTYSSTNTITRTTIIASSNSGSAVSFAAGTKDVFITLPATKTVQLDASSKLPAVDGSQLTGIVTSPVGGGSDKIFYSNDTTVTADYSLAANKNVMSAGPTIAINSDATLTVPSDTTWTVV